MRKFISENKKGVLLGIAICGCAVAGFILSSCALISIMTIKMVIGILLSLICIMCFAIMKQLIYIKLK